MGQAIVAQQTAIQSWGSRDDVREIGNRLAKMSLPGGKKLSEPEIFALAQASIAHGLDPFNGEIWIIPNTGLMIGIKGLRKCARGQIKGNFWTEFRVIDNGTEREQIGIPDGALAYECRLFDTETINAYTTSVKQFSDTKMPWELIMEIVGKRPYTSGYGYYKRGESTKMTPVQCAMKRAEADALKRRFDVPFGMNVDDTADIAPITAPQWDVIDPASHEVDYTTTLESGKAQLGRDEGDLTGSYTPTVTDAQAAQAKAEFPEAETKFDSVTKPTDDQGPDSGKAAFDEYCAGRNMPDFKRLAFLHTAGGDYATALEVARKAK